MKCILKALAETEFRPRAKWWGYVDENGHRHLMRYHHRFVVFQEKPFRKILAARYETKTDRAGVAFAIHHFLSHQNTPTMTTFALIKPSGAAHKDEILRRITEAGFKIESLWEIPGPVNTQQVELHLADLKAKNEAAFKRNVVSLSQGPLTAMTLSYPPAPEIVVAAFRELVGPTDPKQASPTQIRSLSSDSLDEAVAQDRAIQNLIHASDSQENASRETSIWLTGKPE